MMTLRQVKSATLSMNSPVKTRNIHSETISYYDRGQGPPLVLIHGMFGDYLDWEPVLEPLAAIHRVIAPDLPGFGNSSKPRRDYTAAFFVETLHEFFRQLDIDQPILAGNSFGGQIAMFYALAHPENISKLILVNSGGFRYYSDEEQVSTAARFTQPILASFTPQIHAFLFGGVFTKQSETSVRYLAKQNTKLERPDYVDYTHALASNIKLSMASNLIHRLPQITCPTLLLWGESDLVLPVEQAKLALTKLPNAELKTIPGCGHAPQMDCPHLFLEALQEFLSR